MTTHTHTFDFTDGLAECFECGAPASAGDYCKAHGLTVTEVAKATGKTRQTVINWHRNEPSLFRIVVSGVQRERLLTND